MLDSTPRVLDSSAELARVDPQIARLERRVEQFGARVGHATDRLGARVGHATDDRPPDSVRERGRELRQKCPTRDPHEGSSRTEFALWARSYL